MHGLLFFLGHRRPSQLQAAVSSKTMANSNDNVDDELEGKIEGKDKVNDANVSTDDVDIDLHHDCGVSIATSNNFGKRRHDITGDRFSDDS